MSEFSKLMKSILDGTVEQSNLVEFVELIRKISLSYLKYEEVIGRKQLKDLEELALESVAGLFTRNEKDQFIAVKDYFEKAAIDLEDLDDGEIMVLLRKLVIENTKATLKATAKASLEDMIAELLGSFIKGTIVPSQSKIRQPSELGFDLYINPGEATSEEIAEFYDALSELHRSFGGIGVTITDNTSRLIVTENVI